MDKPIGFILSTHGNNTAIPTPSKVPPPCILKSLPLI